MAQATSNTQSASNADRPERSRNAKAQARHRAKRKAYIEQVHTHRRPVGLPNAPVLTVHSFFFVCLRAYVHIYYIARADRDQAPDGARALA